MQRSLTTVALPQHVRFKLHNAGFTTLEDIAKTSVAELVAETQLTTDEGLKVLEFASMENGGKTSISALTLLMQENAHPSIPTFCEAIDSILGGGIPLKKITEICGVPGAGKTQMCKQLCINVQIPTECGGLDGEAFYIDTEGSFTVDRLKQIAESTVDTCHKILESSNNHAAAESFNVETVLSRVHYFLCKNHIELVAIINMLPEYLRQRPKVRLLVIDSICFHFRYGFEENYMVRTKLLNMISQALFKIAHEFTLAILITNHMTTKVQENERSCLIPALGKSWGHICNMRVILSWDEQTRVASLVKSSWKPDGKALYQITVNGIRDVPNEITNMCPSTSDSPTENLQQSKKPKIDI